MKKLKRYKLKTTGTANYKLALLNINAMKASISYIFQYFINFAE